MSWLLLSFPRNGPSTFCFYGEGTGFLCNLVNAVSREGILDGVGEQSEADAWEFRRRRNKSVTGTRASKDLQSSGAWLRAGRFAVQKSVILLTL